MRKLEYMPVFMGALYSDLRFRVLGPAARWIYLELSWIQWREGSIPADRAELLRVIEGFPCDRFTQESADALGLSPFPGNIRRALDWPAMLDDVLKFFVASPDLKGRLFSPELKKIFKKLRLIRLKRSQAAASQWVARGQKRDKS